MTDKVSSSTASKSSLLRLGETLKSCSGFLPYVASFTALLIIWHVVSAYGVRSILFPSPIAVAVEMVKLIENGTLLANIGASLQRILKLALIG